MKPLSFRFLGPPQVVFQGQTLAFPTRKTLALLVYLVAESIPHQRDKLAALLWPESDQEAGRAALRNTLARLRNSFKEQTGLDLTGLSVSRDSLQFQPQAETEADLQDLRQAFNLLANRATSASPATFELLQEVTKMYRGDFLEGFFLGDAPDYEQWVSYQRESWHHRAVPVFERLSAWQSERGELNAALDTATHWATFDSLNEAAYQQLIRLHLALGHREAALQAYEACRKMLETEFKSPPAPATQALLAQVRTAPAPRPKTATATAPGPDWTSRIPLLGRAAEHSRLVEQFNRVFQGKTGQAVIVGEAGIGKTRLAQEFTRFAQAQGADVLAGQAFETGGRLPYQPLLTALRHRLEIENAPDDLLADLWLTELSRLLPELHERYPDLPPPANLGEAEARGILFEAVARLLQALAARKPLLLLIDDLQWADSATLDLLHYLSRRLTEQKAPALLLLTTRSEALATDPALAEWLGGLERENNLLKVSLTPLSPADTGQLVGQLLDPPPSGLQTGNGPAPDHAEFTRWLYRETGGQPFFLLETLKALVERKALVPAEDSSKKPVLKLAEKVWDEEIHPVRLVAPGVREVIRARLGRLSGDAFGLLAAGAVLDHAFSFEQLCGVAGLDENTGLNALDQLLKHSLLKEGSALQAGPLNHPANPVEAYFFSHDKIRDVAYTEAGDARRRVFHRRALRLFEASGAAWASLAHHAEWGGLPVEALKMHLKAGDNALRLYAVRDALGHYRQALALWHRQTETANLENPLAPEEVQQLFTQLGRGYELNNQESEATATYEELLDYGLKERQPKIECVALNRLATLEIHTTFNIGKARSLLQRALVLAGSGEDLELLAETEWNLGHLALYQLENEDGRLHGNNALTLARRIGKPDLIARSLNVLSYHEAGSAFCEAASAHGSEAGLLYALLGDKAMETDSLNVVAEAQFKLGRLEQALETLQKTRRISEEISNEWGLVVNAMWRGMVFRDQGKYGEALEQAETGVTRSHEMQQHLLMTFTALALGHVQRNLLNFEAALAAHTEALAILEQEEFQAVLFSLKYSVFDALCADYAALGDWEKALEYARKAISPADEDLFLFAGLTRWCNVEALLRGGETGLAQEVFRRFKERTEATRRYQYIILRCLAVLARAENKPRQALDYLLEAEKIVEEFALAGEGWLLDLAIAGTAPACGNPAEATARREQAARKTGLIASGLPEKARLLFTGRVNQLLNSGPGA
ncbi:MAG: AAA family ATPase [Chloroflexi bacterium]|nr:AAA family ATPase [Chloroflexota bacterium]OJW03455.1 MAG: hypothetical protein BGO39_10645 [Chloroflexi bacterium 54-19]